jgi:XTP/dITP diphosphohydrolase
MIVFATNNAHKLGEIRQILAGRMDVKSLADIGCTVTDIPETADTLEGNAEMKARFIHDNFAGVDCFADDTGLEVEALGGAPGVYSARYAGGEGHNSAANMAKLLREMQGKTNRRARFRTVIALILNGELSLMEGEVHGTIATEPHGTDGFGYDPIFLPDEGDGLTFAQMSAEQKNAISHRGRAMKKLIEKLNSLG